MRRCFSRVHISLGVYKFIARFIDLLFASHNRFVCPECGSFCVLKSLITFDIFTEVYTLSMSTVVQRKPIEVVFPRKRREL